MWLVGGKVLWVPHRSVTGRTGLMSGVALGAEDTGSWAGTPKWKPCVLVAN